MKKKQLKMALGLSFINCLLPLCATLISCSSDDEEEQGTEQSTDGRKLRQLTIADVPMTRATLSEVDAEGGKKALSPAWTASDVATYINLKLLADGMGSLRYGDLTASESAATSAFTGSVYCGMGDQLAFIYPAVEPTTGLGSYTIDLKGQKGTLTDIAQRYHYIYGVGEVTSVTEETANATVSSMKSLLAVCKFTFMNGSDTIPVKTLTISYGTDISAGYPLAYSIVPNMDADDVCVPTNLSPSGDLLIIDTNTVNGLKSVYVALFPVSSKQEFFFSVNNNSNTFTFKAKAKLLAGKYYPVTLTLN